MKSMSLRRSFLIASLITSGAAFGAPAGIFDVRDYGAKGDGAANDAPAINKAIDAASAAGGGTVEVGAGTYLSGSIHLKSDVTLHLGPGSTIVASSDGNDYDKPEANAWGDVHHFQDFGHSHWHDSLIWGEDLVNIAITGTGRIYGKGLGRGWEKEVVPQYVGNKGIALRNCRNVVFRDFTIQHGGWFAILATGVDNFVLDALTLDTQRDGMDIDCCHNVRVSNCSVNSPWDDGICLKCSYGLGQFRSTDNVTITNCFVSGYDEGTLLDGTRTHLDTKNPYPTGRIKFGTESNGGYQAITISNCVFECCRGLAMETVDGALVEDVTVTNIAMRHIFTTPIFLRLGERMRGPEGTPVGKFRHVIISNIVAEDIRGDQAILISGVPGHDIEDVTLSDMQMEFTGGILPKAPYVVPELEKGYPEPETFGPTTSWGLYARHVVDLTVRNLVFRTKADNNRPVIDLDDVHTVELDRVKAPVALGNTDWWQPAAPSARVTPFLAQSDVDGLIVESGGAAAAAVGR